MKRIVLITAATLALVTVGTVGEAQAQAGQPVCEDSFLRDPTINEVADSPDMREAAGAITDVSGYDGIDLAEDLPQLATGHGEDVSDCATGSDDPL